MANDKANQSKTVANPRPTQDIYVDKSGNNNQAFSLHLYNTPLVVSHLLRHDLVTSTLHTSKAQC